MTMTEAVRIAVSGYYGCGNVGDEAVLAGIKEAITAASGGTAELVVLSQNPDATRTLHQVDAAYRMDMKTVRGVLRQSDLLISGGGSLLQDTTSFRSLLYYLAVVRLGRMAGVPVMFYAQGMGPLRRRLSRLLVRLTANRVAYITVRDEPSAQLLAAIGVNRPPIEVTADPAFALSPAADSEVDACWAANALPTDGRPLIGVALRRWAHGSAATPDVYAQLVNSMEERLGADVVMIPMQSPDDRTFSDEVSAAAGHTFHAVRTDCSPAMILGLVKRMSAVVAMRLHTLIFAARASVPMYALSYDPKVDNLMHLIESSDLLAPVSGFNTSEVCEKLAMLLAERPSRAAALSVQSRRLQLLALRNAEIALSLVMSAAK